MFQYEFMRSAFIVGGLLAIIIPIVGLTGVLQRRSMIGDAMSHVSLAGICFGLIMGFNPVVGAVILSLFAALSIDFIQKKLGRYQEIAIAVLMSAGVGLSGVLMGFIKNPANFNSFLFGSIVAIDSFDNMISIVLSMLVIVASIRYYREFLYLSFDSDSAKVAGIRVAKIQRIITVLTAITIAIASRVVGALVVSSLMVMPVASAMQVGKSYRQTLLLSILFSLISVWVGLTIAYYENLRPGGTIVLVGVGILILALLYKEFFRKR